MSEEIKQEEQNVVEETSEATQDAVDTTQESASTEQVVEEDETLQLKEEIEDLNNQIYRLSAEIANIQKRNAKERQDAAKYRSQSLAQNILPALDNLERALSMPLEGEQAQSFRKGIEMVQESLLVALKDEGVEEIDALGKPFDPLFHQAVQTIPATPEQEADVVVQVFQKGYVLKDRVLRPAMVVVSQ